MPVHFAISPLVGLMLFYHLYNEVVYHATAVYEATSDVYPMLFECWASVADAGPTFKQHWLNASFFFWVAGYIGGRIFH